MTAESRHFATAFTRIQTRSRAKPTKIAVKCRIPDRHFTGAVKNIEFFLQPLNCHDSKHEFIFEVDIQQFKQHADNHNYDYYNNYRLYRVSDLTAAAISGIGGNGR